MPLFFVAALDCLSICFHLLMCSRRGQMSSLALVKVERDRSAVICMCADAVIQNEIRIVQASLLGSILANLLLILGMCFLWGGLRFREQVRQDRPHHRIRGSSEKILTVIRFTTAPSPRSAPPCSV